MTKFQITTTHPAFGEVIFIIEAEDSAKAFTKWKSVVFNPRQWNVRSNSVLAQLSLRGDE